MRPANNAPIYASIYAELAEVCRQHGYALAIHGSLARDFDLVCIPWNDKVVSDPVQVVESITDKFALRLVREAPGRGSAMKKWGREVFTLVAAWGDTSLDLSFTPRVIDV